jgi:molybdenum cofactor biosynthesis protein A
MVDNFSRPITYLRLSVTDRCNLACSYCMPENGIQLRGRGEILSWGEMLRLVRIFAALGISKLRITGGEPLVRRGIIDFLRQCSAVSGLHIHLTTNGLEIEKYLPAMLSIGLAGINFSLDTLDPQHYYIITRGNAFATAVQSFYAVLASGIPVKVNSVVTETHQAKEIIAISDLARLHSIQVRFIEKMPFTGTCASARTSWTAEEITCILWKGYPEMQELAQQNASAKLYQIPGFAGQVGVIAGFSRQFCTNCNRVRITSTGQLKNCLYGATALDVRKLLRSGCSDAEISAALLMAIKSKSRNGFEAENLGKELVYASMSQIGG